MTFAVCHMIFALALSASGEDGESASLQLTNAGAIGGVQHMQAGVWSTMRAQVKNDSDREQTATYSLYLDKMPNVQFTTKVWVPPRARRSIELPVRAPDAAMLKGKRGDPLREKAFSGKGLLLENTPQGEMRLGIGDFLVMRRSDRPITTMIAGADTGDLSRRIVAAIRDVSRYPPRTHFLRATSLPLNVEGWQGVDALIICAQTPQIDGVQREAIRRWVASGGRLWVMLDTVTEVFAAELLQDAWTCSVVDTVTLTDICIRQHEDGGAEPWPTVDAAVAVDHYRDPDGLLGALRMAVVETLDVDPEKVVAEARLVEDLGFEARHWVSLARRLAMHFHVGVDAGDLQDRMETQDAVRVADLVYFVREKIDVVDVNGGRLVVPEMLDERLAGGRVLLRHPDRLTHKNQRIIQAAIATRKPASLYLEREYERPLRMVRLVAPAWETLYTVKGWPAAIRRRYGYGWVLATTLEAQGWIRPREDHDMAPSGIRAATQAKAVAANEKGDAAGDDAPAKPTVSRARSSYVARHALKPLARWFNKERVRELVPQDAYSKMAVQQVGYTIIGRKVIMLILGFFVAGIAVTGLLLRTRRQHREYVAVVGAVLAVVLCGMLVAIGSRHRHAIPLTMAKVEVVQITTDPDYAIVSGVLGTYAPEADKGPLSARKGGLVWPDREGQETERLRLIWSDLGQWTWDNLRLPSGAMRDNAFHYVTALEETTGATLTFDAEGARITLTRGGFTRFEDPMIVTPNGRMAVRTVAEDQLVATEKDRLHAKEFIRGTGGLTTDVQQRRAEFYSHVIPNLFEQSMRRSRTVVTAARPEPKLLGFSSSIDTGFTLPQEFKTRDETLLVIPVRTERPSPGTAVTVPSHFVAMEAMRGSNQLYNPPLPRKLNHAGSVPHRVPKARTPWMAPVQGGGVRLRFVVPESLVPWQVTLAELSIKLRAEDRTLTVRTVEGDHGTKVHESISPSGTVTVLLPPPTLKSLGTDGQAVVEIRVSAVKESSEKGASESRMRMQGWQMESVSMQLKGEIVQGL